MKAFGYLFIGALALNMLVPTLGYEVQPLYGRTFNLFSLLSSPQAMLARLTSLATRYSLVQSAIDVLTAQYTSLQTLYSSLQAQLTALINSQPKCPVSATGGLVLGIYCYTVTTTPTTFVAAQADCQAKLGTLAQPTPNVALSKAFYAAVKAKFPTKFATIEAGVPNPAEIWIGYERTSPTLNDPLLALNGLGQVLRSNPILNPLADTAGILAAAITNPGSTWSVLDPSLAASTRPYICQFNLI